MGADSKLLQSLLKKVSKGVTTLEIPKDITSWTENDWAQFYTLEDNEVIKTVTGFKPVFELEESQAEKICTIFMSFEKLALANFQKAGPLKDEEHFSRLQFLVSNLNRCSEFNFSGLRMGNKCSLAVCKILKEDFSHKLRVLNLSANNLTQRAASYIVDLSKKCQKLETVDLSKNKIGDQGKAKLVSHMQVLKPEFVLKEVIIDQEGGDGKETEILAREVEAASTSSDSSNGEEESGEAAAEGEGAIVEVDDDEEEVVAEPKEPVKEPAVSKRKRKTSDREEVRKSLEAVGMLSKAADAKASSAKQTPKKNEKKVQQVQEPEEQEPVAVQEEEVQAPKPAAAKSKRKRGEKAEAAQTPAPEEPAQTAEPTTSAPPAPQGTPGRKGKGKGKANANANAEPAPAVPNVPVAPIIEEKEKNTAKRPKKEAASDNAHAELVAKVAYLEAELEKANKQLKLEKEKVRTQWDKRVELMNVFKQLRTSFDTASTDIMSID